MTNDMPSQPRIFVAIVPNLYDRLFAPRTDQALRRLGQVELHAGPGNLTSAELARRIGPFDAVISGWGTPAFDDSVLAEARHLRIVAHSAGSIKHLLSAPLFERGVAVTHAAAAIAPAVAEMSLALTMMLLRRIPQFTDAMRGGRSWQEAAAIGRGTELAGTRVGVVGAGHAGRCFIRLLRAVGAEVWICDPYLTDEAAAELGVGKVELDELLRSCPVVSLHAPSTPQTRHMIGRRQLALLRDGSILINTARSWLLDEPALLEELRHGRLIAALDVFDQEPLPADSPFRSLPNAYLMPHVAGASAQTDRRQGELVVEELERFFSGRPLRFPVTLSMLPMMA